MSSAFPTFRRTDWRTDEQHQDPQVCFADNKNLLSLQLYPEVEEIALEHLRQALNHYEKKKDVDERKKRFLTDPESELETIEAH